MDLGFGNPYFSEHFWTPSTVPQPLKHKAVHRVIDDHRFQCEQTKAMLGVVPMMSFFPNRTNPREDLIKRVRAIVTKGLMSQKRIAEDLGLSQTKMSQFMNGAKRLKGWKPVEKLIEEWLTSIESDQGPLPAFESDEQSGSDPSTSESDSLSPLATPEPMMRNIYQSEVQVTVHSNVAVPEDQLQDAHPAPGDHSFNELSNTLTYCENYSVQFPDEGWTYNGTWNFWQAGFDFPLPDPPCY